MKSNRPENPTLGVVIPCYNEQAVLPELVAELEKLAAAVWIPVHFLFVDDGSSDRTPEFLEALTARDERFAALRFARNFGHQTAVSAGLMHARGDLVAVIDADLQDPPSLIAEMTAKWREGYDVVYGVRRNRKEGPWLRFCYSAFYQLLKRIANVELPLDAGDFCVMDRRVVERINRMPEHNRFVRGLRGWAGGRQVGLTYDRAARAAGEPKYGLIKLFNLALDGLVSFSWAPLRLAVWLGLAASFVSFLLLAWAVVATIATGTTPPGWASLAVIVLFLGGVQLIVLGIFGEYLGRVFEEVKNRPHFLEDCRLGWLEKEGQPDAPDPPRS